MQISGCNDKSAFTGLVSSDPAIDCFGQAGYTGLPQFENRDTKTPFTRYRINLDPDQN